MASVNYYSAGRWSSYASAADIRHGLQKGSFSYVPKAGGPRVLVDGKIVSVQTIKQMGLATLPNALYYQRTSAAGPKVFSITQEPVKAPKVAKKPALSVKTQKAAEIVAVTPSIVVSAPKKAAVPVPVIAAVALAAFITLRGRK